MIMVHLHFIVLLDAANELLLKKMVNGKENSCLVFI